MVTKGKEIFSTSFQIISEHLILSPSRGPAIKQYRGAPARTDPSWPLERAQVVDPLDVF